MKLTPCSFFATVVASPPLQHLFTSVLCGNMFTVCINQVVTSFMVCQSTATCTAVLRVLAANGYSQSVTHLIPLLQLPTDGPTGDSLASVPLRPPSAKGGRKRQSSNEGANQAALDGEAEGGTQQQLPPQGRAAERPVRQVEEDGVKEEPGAQVGMTQEDEEDHPSTPPLPPMAIALVLHTYIHTCIAQ